MVGKDNSISWEPDKACDGCLYYQCLTHGGIWICNYILMRGHRRPCEPGKACTVRVKMKRCTRKRKGEKA